MIKKIYILIILIFTLLITGNNTMARDNLTQKQQNIVMISSYTASGDLVNLEKSLRKSLDDGMTINEIGRAHV